MRRSIRGVVEAIQESWPLQFVIRSGGHRTAVALAEDAAVTRSGQPSTPAALASGQRVAVTGTEAAGGPGALRAERVEIL